MNIKNLAHLALVSIALAAGCATNQNQSAAPSTPVTQDALATLRASFAQADPNARLGAVVEVLPGEMFLRVGDVGAADFPVGTAVAIIDSNRNTIAYGEVVNAGEGNVHVRYQQSGARAPTVGDVAVRF